MNKSKYFSPHWTIYILDLNNTTVMYYLKTFETTEEYNKSSLICPNVSLTKDDNLLHFKMFNYADLGLTSGTLWMKCNIGATSETDYGLYFQWGDTVGYTDTSHSTWSTCPGNGGNSSYNSTSITVWDKEHLTNGVLKTDVDAAYVHTNGKAKMPTVVQCQELLNETDHTWVEDFNGSGINGMKFVNKKDSSKYIFIPASGNAWGGSFNGVGNFGLLWSSSVDTSLAQFAGYLDFGSDYYGVYDISRRYGHCVRGVVK